jgi:hypothetical protein
MSQQPYSFCFLRYHHDIVTGEFANVAVLLWAPESKYLGFKSCRRYGRLSKFFGKFASEDYPSLMKRLDTRFDRLAESYIEHNFFPEFEVLPKSASALAIQIVPEDDGALRWSPSQGGLTEHPEVELAAIYEKFIGSKNEAPVSNRRDEKIVYETSYKSAFENVDVKPFIRPFVAEAPLVTHEFGQAWKNGAWNVYEPISLDYAEEESIANKAYRWDSRARHLCEVEEPPKIHFLLGAPRDGHEQAYGKAKDILYSSHQETNVSLIEENEAADFAAALHDRVLAAHS